MLLRLGTAKTFMNKKNAGVGQRFNRIYFNSFLQVI